MGRIIDLAALAAVLETSLKKRAPAAGGLQEQVGKVDFICDGQRTTITSSALDPPSLSTCRSNTCSNS